MFTYIIGRVLKFVIFLVLSIFIFRFLITNIKNFAFSFDFFGLFINNFILFFSNLIIFIGCYFKYSQNIFLQYLPLYISCLFSLLLNDDIVCIEKPDEILLPIFAVDEVSRLFSHPSIFSIKHSKSA